MSWSMWHIYGIGFDLSEVDLKKYKAFIENHKVCHYKKVLEVIEDKNFDENDIRDRTDSYTLAEPIVDVMFAETGIRFDYPGLTDDGEDYVLFCQAYPWNYNEIERNLTHNSLVEIMKKYANELGVTVSDDVDLIYAG